MLTLAIHTAAQKEAVALLKEKRIQAEISWTAHRDESEVLLKNIENLLAKKRKAFRDIRKIIVIVGPGPFSAVRIGVTVANTLAYSLGARLFGLDTETFWAARAPQEDAVLLLHAGGNFVYCRRAAEKPKLLSIEDALTFIDKKRSMPRQGRVLALYGDLSEAEMSIFQKLKRPTWKFIQEKALLTLGETLLRLPASAFKPVKTAEPLYFRPPNITKPAA